MPLRVIYIDDEFGLCQAFEDIFASSEIAVTTFVDPEEGLKAINAGGADLVLLDFRLPNCTGEEVAARIKVPVPVALISGDLHLKVTGKYVRVFTKPFDFDEMAAFLASQASEKPLNK
jgi:DNA-binding NtrC family response regulator